MCNVMHGWAHGSKKCYIAIYCISRVYMKNRRTTQIETNEQQRKKLLLDHSEKCGERISLSFRFQWNIHEIRSTIAADTLSWKISDDIRERYRVHQIQAFHRTFQMPNIAWSRSKLHVWLAPLYKHQKTNGHSTRNGYLETKKYKRGLSYYILINKCPALPVASPADLSFYWLRIAWLNFVLVFLYTV